ncbi:unnamed protein product [Darwinula stevensoni]|uniref:receptor protein-tyrosine kinase n=1 Tax=Darwinula stevensoni TaxID=69355 RepID=A0A7R8X234_9CRUS|nr:unnamed protein product [Darwinula stevensoni]CAG0880734.1 unnamed protein product [Darwinula stevensoni]
MTESSTAFAETHWMASNVDPDEVYVFRVTARNGYGSSDPSRDSRKFSVNVAIPESSGHHAVVLGVVISVLLALMILATAIFFYLFKRKEAEKKMLNHELMHRDMELATLPELPRDGNFIQATNAIYLGSDPPTDEEIALLPRIAKEDITLTHFLGSGAFGEVYEGVARNVQGFGPQLIKVAIKQSATMEDLSEEDDNTGSSEPNGHDLMIQCWRYDPSGRPSFEHCLNQLKAANHKLAQHPEQHEQIGSRPVHGNAVHNRNYLASTSTPPGPGFQNPAYDEEDSWPLHSGDSLLSTVSNVSNNDRTQLLPDSDPTTPTTTEIPKYLDLVSESESTDGYEVPNRARGSHPNLSRVPSDTEPRACSLGIRTNPLYGPYSRLDRNCNLRTCSSALPPYANVRKARSIEASESLC